MKKKILVILILTFISVDAFACSCGKREESLTKKVKRSYNNSDLIFSGKVIEIIELNTSRLKSSADPIIYKFVVNQIIKGKTQKKIIEIVSKRSEASCGYNFKLSKVYLVYSRKSTRFSKITKNKFDYSTSLCSRNQILNLVKKKELKILKS